MSANPSQPSSLDPQLVERACRSDIESQDLLFWQFRPRLLCRATRFRHDSLLAQDICQEACLRILQKLPDLPDPAAFEPWALAFVDYQVRNTFRWLGRGPEITPPL